MAKARTIYSCRECGAEQAQWFGKCPSCGTFDALEEKLQSPTLTSSGRSSSRVLPRRRSRTGEPGQPQAAVAFSQIKPGAQTRLSSGYGELDRVLGGGVVPGSLVLIGGDPGIGKSTLLLQVADQLAQKFAPILYVCAEESALQVKLRAARLGIADALSSLTAASPDQVAKLYALPETDLELIVQELHSLKPQVAIIDSIQTLHWSAVTSAPGSVVQVRECTSALMQLAKRENIALFIVGHVTKEGAIAGPRVLEHLVDTVLYFEGDRYASHRLLRAAKNRFGATHEIGIFEMRDVGLAEVLNPSALFLSQREEAVPGTATVVACEGTRPLAVELQALVSPTSYGSPRRSAAGINYNRLQQILAVLEKRVGLPLSKLDAYVSAAGGINVDEPAADLGIAIALAASFRDRIVDAQTVLIGEVGLGGQVRSVSQMELRLQEAAKLGFQRAIIPVGVSLSRELKIEIIQVAKVTEAIVAAIPVSASQGSPHREAEDTSLDAEN